MKTLKTLFTAWLLVILFSCSEDDPKTKTFLDKYLTEAGFTEVTEEIDGGTFEFGISFIPAVNGKITDIIVRLPDDATDLRVTIWDAELETVLRTETIASVTAGKKTTKSIEAFSLTAGEEYMITFNSNDWYSWTQPDGGDITYPITVGNIAITGYAYIAAIAQTFPTEFQTDYYAGDLYFTFEKD